MFSITVKDNNRDSERQEEYYPFLYSLCYNNAMDFSKPDNARKINRLKVLNALRKEPLSRAELSRALSINKVSISEIMESLINEGLVENKEKDTTTSGRPSTKLTIRKNNGRVFSFVFTSLTVTVAASNLLGNILRFERFPRGAETLNQIKSFLKKMTLDSPIVYGVTVVSREKEPIERSFFPWPVIYSSFSSAEARAEMDDEEKKKTLFLSWGETIEAQYENTYIPTFGHMKVSSSVLCSCGAIGCLEAICSGLRLKELTGIGNIRKLTTDESGIRALEEASKHIAFALSEAVQAIGAERVVITGELSSLPKSIYSSINDNLKMALPPDRESVTVYKSTHGEASALEGAGIIALDEFFYHSALLNKLKSIESTL